jgi:hypothetical protein
MGKQALPWNECLPIIFGSGVRCRIGGFEMTRSKAWVPLAAVAFALSLGLAAGDEGGPEQQTSNPSTEQPGDAAATPESDTQKTE